MTTYDTILSSIRTALDLPELSLEKPREAARGDYATNAAMQMAKAAGRAPREIANELLPKITALPFIESAEIAGPGFINIKIKNDFIIAQANAVDLNPKMTPKTIVVDYAGYNVGKELHVGHLRVSIIGDSFVRIGRFLGHKMIGYNHMGDWGRNMAMVIAGIQMHYPNDWDKPNFVVKREELNNFYVDAGRRAKEDDEFMAKIRRIKLDLQNYHAEYFALYEKFLKVSLDMMHETMRRLNMIKLDNDKGEKHASEYVDAVEKLLREKNMLVMSDGAEVINVKRDDDTAPMPPYMFRDSRGATSYDTADVAMAYYRKITDNPDIGVYFVDFRQSLHFEQLFRVMDKLELFPYGTLEHHAYGVLTGRDNKPFKTRDGGVANLSDIIDMTDDAVRARVAGGGKNLPEETIKMIALAAIKFNDFMHELRSDYVFDMDTITSFEGRTGPYILYTAVRLNSALAKAQAQVPFAGEGAEPVQWTGDQSAGVVAIENDYERDLLLKILDFPKMIVTAFEKRAMDILANYSYDLAGFANVFYHHCPIKDDANRTAIARLTARTLTQCIELMGLSVPAEM